MKKLLFITNGHGENLVAAQIIKYLPKTGVKIDVFPVVGSGDPFKKLKVGIIGPRYALPGGGFSLRNFSYLIKDIFSGLLIKVFRQIKLILSSKGKYDLVVGVGDSVPLIYSIMTVSPFIFLGINKSEHYKKFAFNYTGFEKWLLKKYKSLTIARDEKTANSLKSKGISAIYVGNPMMDAVQSIPPSSSLRQRRTGRRAGRTSGHQKIGNTRTIGFLPGTREDAYKNIEDFYKIAWQIRKLDKNINFLLSFPNTMDKLKLSKISKPFEIEMSDDFNKVLSRSNIVIGLSGTGNEQAAGLGIPVMAFPGRGAQFNNKFATGQKELLGDALLLLKRDSLSISYEAISLLNSKKRMTKMAKTGKSRMGRPGASKKIAKIIMKRLKNG